MSDENQSAILAVLAEMSAKIDTIGERLVRVETRLERVEGKVDALQQQVIGIGSRLLPDHELADAGVPSANGNRRPSVPSAP